jgi:hypothetical protein
MKLKNTIAVKTALVTYAFSWLCGLPQIVHETASHDTAFAIGAWGVYTFFAGATLWGMIQLSSLRKQAQEFAERLRPTVDSLGSHEQFAAPSR